MIYPEKIKENDIIGITAPSCGFTEEEELLRIENSKKKLQEKGFRVIETPNVRMQERGRSSSKQQRAKELMELLENPKVKSIILAAGGDFLCEVLDELDFEKLKKLEPKWLQGYSDVTNLGFVFTTNLDIATIYGPTYKTFGMENWHISLENSIKLMQKEEFVQNSYKKCTKPFIPGVKEIEDDTIKDPYRGYDLTEPVKWINLNNEEKIEFEGRAIGGCFDVIQNLIGTKYDKVKEYIEKYKKDGIVWFLEVFESSTPGLFCNLWKMKNAGYFENCKGIIFGRPLMMREDFEISYREAIKDAIGDLNIPIILDSDIGHVAPQIPIVNGSIIEIESFSGKGSIKCKFLP